MPLHAWLTRIASLLAVLLAAGACGSSDFKADPSGVNEIRTVAVVSFAVPKYITEEHGGSNFGGYSGLAQTITKYSGGDGETAGNGQQAAADAAAGFIEAMERSGRWRILPLADVTRNDEIRGLARLYDENMNGRMAGPDGLPIIRLRMDSKPSEFARQAAFVLGVDGVMMLDASDMGYIRGITVQGARHGHLRAVRPRGQPGLGIADGRGRDGRHRADDRRRRGPRQDPETAPGGRHGLRGGPLEALFEEGPGVAAPRPQCAAEIRG
jgi:hypothetical protein